MGLRLSDADRAPSAPQSPASTVPISQRCTSSQLGRVPRNTAIEPAASAIIALTLTLIDDLDRAQHQRLRQHAALRGIDELRQQRQIQHRDLRIQQIGDEAHREQFARAVDRQLAHLERRAAARLAPPATPATADRPRRPSRSAS